MYDQIIHLLMLFVLAIVSRGEYNDTELDNDYDESLSVLRDALAALENLTDTQKQVLEQQRSYEEKVTARHREEETRQAARSTALLEEKIYLNSIWKSFRSKLKSLMKSRKGTNKDSCFRLIRPRDCADLYLEGEDVSGVYQIWPIWSNTSFPVYCDMDTDGGGWTMLHRWGNYRYPADYYDRNWNEYKNGFGNLETSFWLGNDKMYTLTRQEAYELRLDIRHHEESKFSRYRGFWIENEERTYRIHVASYDNKGTGGDYFREANGEPFSTTDARAYRCHQVERPGWWISDSCSVNNVFRLKFGDLKNSDQRLFTKEMKIRPILFKTMKELS